MKKLKIKFLPLVAALAFVVTNILPVVKAVNTYATTSITAIYLASTTTTVQEGALPEFSISTGPDSHLATEAYGSNTTWLYWGSGDQAWHAFGTDEKAAVADGTTHYGLSILTETTDNEYVISPTATIYFNDVDHTNTGYSQISVNDEHSVYVIIDLGTANASVTPPVQGSYTVNIYTNMHTGTYTVNYTTDNPSENMGVELNSDATFEVPAGTTMNLTATPAATHRFMGWYTGHYDNSGDVPTFGTDELISNNATTTYTPTSDQYIVPVSSRIVTVTVNVNGGNPINPNTIQGTEGQLLGDIFEASGIIPTHSNPNKMLVGACLDANCEQEVDGDTPVWNDMEVYLKWQDVVPHTITYNLNYGDNPQTIEGTAYEGIDVEFIENPERQDYIFGGWFEDPECHDFFDGQGGITSDKTLYACWLTELDSIELTVAAPQVGENVTLTYNQEFDIYEPNIVPNVTENERYNSYHPDWVQGTCSVSSNACDELFEGTFQADTDYYARIDIYASEGYAITVNTLDHITVNGEAPAEYFGIFNPRETMIIARLHTDNVTAYTVTFDSQGGEPVPSMTRNAGTVTQLPDTHQQDRAFGGWQIWDEYDQPVTTYAPGDNFTFNADVTVHALWLEESNQRTVTFHNYYSGSTGTMEPIPKNVGETFTFPECGYTNPENMVFSNWTIQDNEGNHYYWPGDTLVIQDNIDVIVNFVSDNFIPVFSAYISQPTVGDTVTTPTVATNDERYTVTIENWYEGDNAEAELTTPLANDAVFQAGHSYIAKVSFDLTGSWRVGFPVRVNFNDTIAYAWTASGVREYATFVMEPIPATPTVYTYSFFRDYGTSEEVSYATNIVDYINGKKQTFINAIGEHEGLDFDPLFSSSSSPYMYARAVDANPIVTTGCTDNTGQIASEEYCANHTEGYRYERNTTYRYVEVQVTKKTTVDVEFDSNGGSDVNPQTINGGTTATEPETPVRDGYYFAGWSVGEAVINETTGALATGKSLFNFGTAINDDTTLVANWKKYHTVSYDMGNVLPSTYVFEPQQVIAGGIPDEPVATNGTAIFDIDEYNHYSPEKFYTEAGFNNEYTGTPITGDTTLYLKWTDNLANKEQITEVNITYDAPMAGTVITGTNYADQTPRLAINIPDGAKYKRWSDSSDENDCTFWKQEKSFTADPFFGTLEMGHSYTAAISLEVNDNATITFARNLVVKVNGETVAASDLHNYYYGIYFLATVTPATHQYTMLEGANQTRVKGENDDEDMHFRADGDLDKVTSVLVDNNLTTDEDRELSSGSTIVDLKSGFVNSLAAGNHTLTINYINGTVSTNFTIVDPNANPVTADIINVWNTLFVVSFIGLTFGVVKLAKSSKE